VRFTPGGVPSWFERMGWGSGFAERVDRPRRSSLIERGLTKWSSAASVASPLQRRVRRRAPGEGAALALTRPTMNLPMVRQPRPRPCSQVGRDDSTVPKRQSRIDFSFLPSQGNPKSRNGWRLEGTWRDAHARKCWEVHGQCRGSTTARRAQQRFKCRVSCAEAETGKHAEPGPPSPVAV